MDDSDQDPDCTIADDAALIFAAMALITLWPIPTAHSLNLDIYLSFLSPFHQKEQQKYAFLFLQSSQVNNKYCSTEWHSLVAAF